ncbi:TonB-dependent receptor [Ancylomarina euxinus]|uniref:TonB-dependent receptor n=1 Tax=Ancylomarina euxinus TaxID=2283627 RepID=A0A425XXM3_9BACT|nr:TonB-dependent receptor [Ancylomarina euxinus]MCZ4694739.1 TonB-dependent receptor [Ancylomarina euxinus]MUP16403.1 SusC/RagA family TonB-linked outer membrane protein [Ancylomarina euxinus]RRG19433.1 TonB-dependent receptor [Ancylomarina euxinus]
MKLNISMFRKLLLMLVMVCSFTISHAQERLVTGTVTDANDGMGIPGVSVVVKGTTVGTSTDIDGKFTVSADATSTLIFSFIGYKTQEILVGTQTQVNVVLSVDTETLSEVVIVGYGQVRKEDATGAVFTVKSDDFNQGTTSSPQDLIVGKIAGVQIISDGGAPGSGSTIRIRGGSSMSASNDPLIVIDGMPLDNRGIDGMSNVLSSLNPNDIETFTVLKDASATAIYGSRASNGVILITTKKGKAGQKIQVTYDSKFSIGKIKETIDVLSADQYRTLVTERAVDHSSVNPALLGQASTDWQDEIYRDATGHEHNIGVSGSYKNIPFRVSAGYTDQKGILQTSEMQRTTGTLNVNPSFFDEHLKINVGVKYMAIENQFADKGAIGSALRMDPTQSVFNKTGIYGGYTTWLMGDGSRNVNATRNPVAQLQQKDDNSDVSRVIADFQADYKLHFLPDLKASMKLGYDYSDSNGDVNTDLDASWVRASSTGVKRDYTQEKKNELVDFYLTYNKDLPSINSKINVMGGYEWQHFWSKSSAFEVDRNAATIEDSKNETENYLVSFFGRANYTFMDKYIVTATLRKDGSSRFHKDNRWGTFPSAAFAWRMSEESFLKDIDVVSNAKVRLGYGITGQQELNSGDYPYMGTYRLSDSRTRYQFGNQFYTLIRPDGYDEGLQWEKTTTYNAGLDFGFFNNRLNGSFDIYKRKTEDLLNTIPVPAGTNFTDRLLTNVGDLENNGFEFSINAIAIETEDLFWELGFNIAYNKNEITRLTNYDDPNYRGVETGGISGVGVGNNIQINAVGHSLNTFYVYEQVYNSNGKPIEGLYVDRNKDGEITTADKYYAKDPAQDYNMGFSSNIKYKDLDFGFNGRIGIGGQMYNNVIVGGRYQEMTVNEYLTNMPSEINKSQFETAQQYSDYFLEDASFFRIDNITLGYNFTKLLKPLLGFDFNARAFATVQNAIVITDYSGLDPEVNGGIDNDVYPRPRTFLFGLNVKF